MPARKPRRKPAGKHGPDRNHRDRNPPQYVSDTSPEDCIVCGEGKGTVLPLYRGQENLGIVNLNSFDLAPVTINRYDDFGKLIEEAEQGSSTHITNTGEGGFFLSVTADTNRGYAHGHLSFDKNKALDMEKTASHLCSDCLNQMMEHCWSDVPFCMGVIDFSTGEIRLFEEKITAFTFGNYYISCDSRDMDEGDLREIDLLIFIVLNGIRTESAARSAAGATGGSTHGPCLCEKPHRKVCSQKSGSAFCRGLGCPQQAKRERRRRASGGLEYP